MLGEVKIAAGGDAFEFLAGQFAFVVALAERESVEDIHSGAGVVGQFLRLLPVFDQAGAWQADVFVKGQALREPVLVPHLPAPVGLGRSGMAGLFRAGHAAADGFDDLVGADEKLQFHLLEFAGAESEIAGVDLVAKGLADLADAKGHLLAGDFGHRFELGENGLGGFRAQVSHVLRAFHRADVGLEHEVEEARLGQKTAVLRVVAGGVLHLFGPFAQQARIGHAALR